MGREDGVMGQKDGLTDCRVDRLAGSGYHDGRNDGGTDGRTDGRTDGKGK